MKSIRREERGVVVYDPNKARFSVRGRLFSSHLSQLGSNWGKCFESNTLALASVTGFFDLLLSPFEKSIPMHARLVREHHWHPRRFLVRDDRGAPGRQQSASSNSDSILRLAS